MPFVVLGLGVLGYVMWRRQGRPGQRYVQVVAAALGWCFVGLCLLFVALLAWDGFRSASPRGQAVLLALVAAGGLAWRDAAPGRRVVHRTGDEDRPGGLRRCLRRLRGVRGPLARARPGAGPGRRLPRLRRPVARVGRAGGDTVFGDMALRAAGMAARNSSSGIQVMLDYAFSMLNIALATFLVVKVRGNRTANLLAIGMVGTAVAFNLQSHAALLVLGDHLGGLTQLWHDLGVHVLAGVAYVFALLLFPDGAIDRSRGPHLIGLALFFGLVLVRRHRRPHERARAAVRRPRAGRGPARALPIGSARRRAPSSASCSACSA